MKNYAPLAKHAPVAKIFLAAVLATSVALSGCDDDSTHYDQYSYPAATSQITSVADVYYAKMQGLTAQSKLITYKMPKVARPGQETTATTVVLVPTGTAPAGGWPIVVWAHGTVGVADQCAPSASADLGGMDTLIASLLIKGYVVVAPDYEGLGSEGIHPFLNANSEGQSIIYAVKAAKSYIANTSSNWMVVGHSQGGHAAIAAAERANEAGLNFKGAVAYAPASNLDSILGGGYQQVANALPTAAGIPIAKAVLPGLQTFSALATAGIRETHPEFQYADAFTSERSVNIAAQAESECIATLTGAFGSDITAYYNVPANALTVYPGLSPTFYNVPAIAEFLNQAKLAVNPVSQPILIVQGEADTTVPVAATRLLETQLRAKGTPVNASYLPGKDHTTVIREGTDYLFDFLQQNMPAK